MSLIGCLAKAGEAILSSDKLILQNMVDKFVQQGEPRKRAEARAVEAMIATYEAQRADIVRQIEKQLGAFGYAIGEPTQIDRAATETTKAELAAKAEPSTKAELAVKTEAEAKPASNEPSALDTRVAELRPKLGEKQVARLDKLLTSYKNGEIDAQRLGDELETLEKQAFPPEQGGQGVMFSRTGNTVSGVKASELRDKLRKLFAIPTMFDKKVKIVQSENDLSPSQRELLSLNDDDKVRGFYDPGTGKVWLIADNIEPGAELAVLLHEVGVHVGMRNMLGHQNYAVLVDQVKEWVKSGTGKEGEIASRAQARVDAAEAHVEKSGGVTLDEHGRGEELLAYFVEEAVLAGIDPTAVASQPKTMQAWFRTLWAAVKYAIRKLGLNPNKLTAQDVVNLAYGAARLELNGTWHGTAAVFRRFNHLFMGTGEGAQAFSWGSYLAQRKNLAYDYFRSEIAKKLLPKSVIGKRLAMPLTDPMSMEVLVNEGTRIIEGHSKNPDEMQKDLDNGVIKFGDLRRIVNHFGYDRLELTDPNNPEAGTITVKSPAGSLMRTDVNAADDELLDLDKPVSEQSDKVKQVLNQIRDVIKANPDVPDDVKFYLDKHWDKLTGGDLVMFAGDPGILPIYAESGFFDDIVNPNTGVKFGETKNKLQLVSDYLDSLGIKGVNFMDGESRKARNNSFDNYRGKYDLSDIFYNIPPDIAEKYNIRDAKDLADRVVADDPAYLEKILQVEGTAEAMWRYKRYMNARLDPDHNIVVFNDKNIQRVLTHVGASANRIKFSRRELPKGKFSKAGEMVNDHLLDTKTELDKVKLGWMTLEHMVARMGDRMPALEQYVKAMHKMQGDAKDIVYQASFIDMEWGKFNDENVAKLGDVMVRSTLANFDPTVDTPKNAEEQAIVDDLAKIRDEEGKTKTAVELFKSVRDFYKQLHEQKLDILRKASKDGKLDARTERMFAEVKGPYFPLMRMDKWYAVGMSDEVARLTEQLENGEISPANKKRLYELRKDGTHYTTRSFATRSEAEKFARESGYDKTYVNTQEERTRQAVRSLPDFEQFEAYIGGQFDSETRQKLKDIMAEMYFDLLPQNSGLKHAMKREGVFGATFGRREFAKSAHTSAHLISRLRNASDLNAALLAVKKAGAKGNIEGRMVYNELLKRADLAMNIENPPQWVNIALSGSYMAHLGLSPGYYFSNLVQTPMITTPWLAARHGLGNTTIALTKALADTKDILKFSYAKGTGRLNWRFEFDWSDKFPEGSGEHELFKQLLERSKLDVTIENDLLAVAEARNGKLRDAMKAFNTPVRAIELVNRSTTALAAYRLGLKKFQGDQQKAINHAIKAVNDTQFDYSTLNAARHMQSVLGSKSLARVVMQFRKFQQGVAYLLISNAYDAVKGEDIETKREARKTLLGLFVTTGLLAGSLGFPAAGTAMFLANMIGQAFDDDDDPFDAETAWKNFLADQAGPEVGAILAKGLPVAFGVDLSKNLGLGDVLSPAPFYRSGSTGKESTGNLLLSLAGAPAGTVADIWDGIYKVGEGDFEKGVEEIIPLKLAKNVLRSIRYSDEGMTDSRGNTVLTADEFNPWDLAMRAMGFKTTKESNYYEANQAVNNSYYAMMKVRDKLIHEATKDGIQVTDAIREFNARHPQNRITYDTLRKSLKEQRRMAQQRTSYGVYAGKQKKPYLERARFADPGYNLNTEDIVDTEGIVETEYQ